jgi:hypothetical protein
MPDKKVVHNARDLPGALLAGEPGPLGWIGEGLALPVRFPAEAEGGKRYEFGITIDVELVDGRLVARRVCVETESARGVTAAFLRDVPIRTLVAETALDKVVRVTLLGKGSRLEHADRNDADVRAAVEAAVGYVEAPR